MVLYIPFGLYPFFNSLIVKKKTLYIIKTTFFTNVISDYKKKNKNISFDLYPFLIL